MAVMFLAPYSAIAAETSTRVCEDLGSQSERCREETHGLCRTHSRLRTGQTIPGFNVKSRFGPGGSRSYQKAFWRVIVTLNRIMTPEESYPA